MKHALVIGGTGMLSTVSLWLVKEGYHVSVVGRYSERMNRLIHQLNDPSNMTPILVDYHRVEKLTEKLQSSIRINGELDLVVAWVHSTARGVENAIIQESGQQKKWRMFHVLSSRANGEQIRKKINPTHQCQYRQVQLGFKVEGNTSRWLTHKEISRGVIDAVKKDQPYCLIGVLELEPGNIRPEYEK